MYHDEPSHRNGQDPFAYAAETEEHYGATVREYQERLQRLDRSDASSRTAKVAEVYEKTIAQYQGYLDALIDRKRAAGDPIAYDYARLDDVVFREDSTPWTQDGTAYTKRDVQALSRGNDEAAKLLIDAANVRGERVLKAAQDDYRVVVVQAAQVKAKRDFQSERLQEAFVEEVKKRLGLEREAPGRSVESAPRARAIDMDR